MIEKFTVEPLGIAYLSSVLKKNGYEVDMLKIDYKDFYSELKRIKPDVLAYSLTTGKHKKFLNLNREIKKEFKVLSVFGGAHATYYPEVINEEGVDVVIRGEADKSFVELLNDYRLGKKVKRIIEFRTLEQNLDRIPLPDRKLLYKYPENRNNLIKNVISSRGCRFKCPYCVLGETFITIKDSKKRIDEVKIGDVIRTIENEEIVETKVENIMNREVDEYYELELEEGTILKVTGEHPVMTKKGWINVEDLCENDEVMTFEEVL